MTIELVVSAETSELESDPSFVVRSKLDCEEVLRVSHDGGSSRIALDEGEQRCLRVGPDEFLLARLSGSDQSYCEFPHPSDYVRSELLWEPQQQRVTMLHELFPQSLEKGVIRRGRLRGAFVERVGDVEMACEQFAVFASSKPILST